MLLRLIMLLFLYIGTVSAMDKHTIEVDNNDMPTNFREIMPLDLVQCATLAAEEKFEEGLDLLKKTDPESVHKEKIYNDILFNLRDIYYSTRDYFSSHIGEYEDSVTEKDLIYNNMLRYFWWSHYYPEYEGFALASESEGI